MVRHPLLHSLLALALVAALAAPALAAPTEAPPGYEPAVDAAFEEFALGNYAEARAQFLRAHALFPNARTLRALGMVDFEEKRYHAALGHLRGALASGVRPLTSEQRKHVQQLVQQAERYVARYRFVVTPEEAGLWVDGAAIEGAQRAELWLDVGEHVIDARAAGYRDQRRRLLVSGQSHETIALVLTPEAARDRSDGSARMLSRGWRIALWTTSALVLAGASALAIVRLTREPEERAPSRGTEDDVIWLPARSPLALGAW